MFHGVNEFLRLLRQLLYLDKRKGSVNTYGFLSPEKFTLERRLILKIHVLYSEMRMNFYRREHFSTVQKRQPIEKKERKKSIMTHYVYVL